MCLLIIRVKSAVEMFSDHVALNGSETNITTVRSNIIFQAIAMEQSTKAYGFSVPNLTWTDHSSPSVSNHFHTFAEHDILSPWESAIFFSEEALRIGKSTIGTCSFLFIYFFVELYILAVSFLIRQIIRQIHC